MQERPSRGHLEGHCGRKHGSTAGFPFGPKHLVFKVRGKIFAVLHVEGSPVEVTFKTEPELARLLRGHYPSVRPAPYFHKRYWSILACDATVPEDEVTELLDTSYDIVVGGLKKSDRESLQALPGR